MKKILMSFMLIMMIAMVSGCENNAVSAEAESESEIPTISQSVHLANDGAIVNDPERVYTCEYYDDGTVSTKLGDGTYVVIDATSDTFTLEAEACGDTLSYVKDDSIYVNEEFSVRIEKGNDIEYTLLTEDGSEKGSIYVDKENDIVTVKDTYDRTAAVFEFNEDPEGYNVTVYDNMICSDTAMLMIYAVYNKL